MAKNQEQVSESGVAGNNNETAKQPGNTTTSLAQTTLEHTESMLSVRFRKYLNRLRVHRVLSIAGFSAIALIILAAVPIFRYSVLGLVIAKPLNVVVVDSTTNTAVTGAIVELGGKSYKTDANGSVEPKVKLGSRTIKVTKQYYKPAQATALVRLSYNSMSIKLVATGRQVPIIVKDKLTGKPAVNITVKVSNTNAKTNQLGRAVIVLPARSYTQKATLSGVGYNEAQVELQITDKVASANTFTVTPVGKVYFLSNQSGKIDVIKTNIDGSDRQTAVAGTGHEDPTATTIYPSPDWKYIALIAIRDSDKPSVYILRTQDDKLVTADEGTASFTSIGWSGDTFVYHVNRYEYNNWQPHAEVLKSYQAGTGKLTILDQTDATGSSYYDYTKSTFVTMNLLGDTVVYGFNWQSASYLYSALADKKTSLLSTRVDGTERRTIRAWDIPSDVWYGYTLQARQSKPGVLNVLVSGVSDKAEFYQYQNGKLAVTNTFDLQNFYSMVLPTYWTSPDKNKTTWSIERDGKRSVLVGDATGDNAHTVVNRDEYTVYGWFDNDKILLTKKNSEMYVVSTKGGAPLKTADYYLPPNYYGY